MAILKNIAKLSDKDSKSREAQFEAEMLALVANGESVKPVAAKPASSYPISTAPVPSIPAAVTLSADGIRISVTANGQTAEYNNLESVPASLRQQIMSAWIAAPASTTPPMLNAPAPRSISLPTPAPTPSPSAKRPRTMKVAMFLNLMIPGAGQFYLGQRLAGAAYALAFCGSFAALLIIFVRGYFNYLNLSTSGDILDAGNLEQVAHAFPAGIISALSTVGLVIYLASTIHLAVSRRRQDG